MRGRSYSGLTRCATSFSRSNQKIKYYNPSSESHGESNRRPLLCLVADKCYFPISQLTRVMGAPNLSHMSCVKQVYRYIAGTRYLGITYGAPDSVVTQASLDGFNYPLTTYVDASLGSEHTKGKSPTGVIVCHYGSPIIWTSHLQSVVALSTMESEMMATSTGTQLTLFARNVFAELGCVQHEPTKVWSDNLSNILCIKNQSSTPRSRHIDLRFHFISEQVSRGAVGILHIPGDSNPADLLTKPLPQPRFHMYRNALMRITTSGSKITSRQFTDNQ